MTLAQLAATVALLAALGLVAGRIGLSTIPAYLLAGLLLGPHAPHETTLIHPSEVTTFVAEIGVVFLLFFLGLEVTLGRLARARLHATIGGGIDLVANFGLGAVVGVAAFGFSLAAVVLAAAIYVSSSAIAVKGLIDFRRLADDETDLVLAILVAEDVVIAIVLGLTGSGGGAAAGTLVLVGKALAFIAGSIALSYIAVRPLDLLLARLPHEIFLLTVFAVLVGMAALAKLFGLSEAIGALAAGVLFSETSARDQIEERFFAFRDVFAALFFFVFGLSIDVGALGEVGWLLAAAVAVTLVAKPAGGYLAGRIGRFTRRQSLNAGLALVAHGEFTVILAQLASSNAAIPAGIRADLVAFAGLYVLVTATVGLVLMNRSKRIGRTLFPAPTLAEGG
jgi:CPA2 family monovalent cation:H+ antiporter-2